MRYMTPQKRAQVLVEALPWLQHLNNKIVVVKYGGNAMIDNELKAAFAADMAFLRTVGVKPVVVHGGGPQITAMLDRLGLEGEFKGGHHTGGHGGCPHGAIRPGWSRPGGAH